MNDKPQSLVKMTRALGQPQNDYVIVGEGSTLLRYRQRPDETYRRRFFVQDSD